MRYQELVELYEKMNQTTKRLEKTQLLSEFIKTIPKEETEIAMQLVSGRVFPMHDERHVGVSTKLVIRSTGLACGVSGQTVETAWKKSGDLGEATQVLVQKKQQRTFERVALDIKKVYHNLRRLPDLTGPGSVEQTIQLIAELITSADPCEAKYIIRTVLEDMRVGLGEGTLRDAIVWAFFSEEIGLSYAADENALQIEKKELYKELLAEIQNAYDLTTDFAVIVAHLKKEGLSGLKSISLEPGRPIKIMLFLKANDITEGFAMVGKPAALEYKYDGFRLLIHKKKSIIKLFTRRLDDVTPQFPDVVQIVSKIPVQDCIFDGEVVGYDPKTGRSLPFQQISQRIKRKYDIEKMVKELPVLLILFDVIYLNGKNFTQTPFIDRRNAVEQVLQGTHIPGLRLSDFLLTDNEPKASDFYAQSLAAGNEGIMMKNLQGTYKPGSRVGFGVKVKPVLETLQLVIVGAEWGTGKRGKWLSSVILACLGSEKELLEIGRVSTGLKDKEEEGFSYGQLTELLKQLILAEDGRLVRIKPKIIAEVDYEEIQQSPSYSSGYALRFPRFVGLRDDLGPEDANTLEDVQRLFHLQRGRGTKGTENLKE